MLKIFAIDPKICQTLEWFRYCTEHCQPSQGRAIADLPYNQWYENAFAIIQDLKLSPLEEKSLKRRLDLVRAQLVHRPGTAWTDWYYDDFSRFSWITEIEREHQRECFSAVISPDYAGADDARQEYHPDELNRTVEAWNTPSGVAITRSPGEFVKAILPMLRIASNIHFVDRFFNVDSNSSFTQNYTQIIKDLAKHRNTPDYPFPSSLTIHCCPDVPEKITENGLKNHYENLIPKGKSVTVLVWQTTKNVEGHAHPFHNRYVVTNHCGVIVGYGTGSYKKKTDAPDILQIIDHEIYLKLWNQIRDNSNPDPIIRVRDNSDPMIYVKRKFEIDGTKSV